MTVQENGVSDSSKCWGLCLERRKREEEKIRFVWGMGVSSALGMMDCEEDRGV